MFDPFWGPVVQEVLKQILPKTAQGVADILRKLWAKGNTPVPAGASILEKRPILPLSMTPLVGREADFAGVLSALRNHRLVTITGLGGVGKTALTQTIARWTWEEEHERNKKNPRGVPYIALDTLVSGKDFASFVYRKLLPDSSPPVDSDEQLREEKTVRSIASVLNIHAVLLVFDNFESVLDEDSAPAVLNFIRDLYASTTDNVHFLITSRRALDLGPMEFKYPLEPLEEKSAIDLFIQRAGEINLQDRPLIAEICRFVDYLPLAIELSARIVQRSVRSLKQLSEALSKTPLDLDVAKNLDFPSRQRGLLATLEYAYEHLPTNSARRLFYIFSVFQGGADRDAVKAVDETPDWERAFNELLAWNLVYAEMANDSSRYQMLSTVRAYAHYQLDLSSETDSIHRRHADFFCELAERAEAHFLGSEVRMWLEKLELEHNNIVAALRWYSGKEETRQDTLRLGSAMWPFWQTRGYQTEGRKHLETILGRNDPAEQSILKAKVFRGAGVLAWGQSDYKAAHTYLEKALQMSQNLSDKQETANSLNSLGDVNYWESNYEQARSLYSASLDLFRTLAFKHGMAQSLLGLANAATGQRDLVKARSFIDEGLRIAEELDNHLLISNLLNSLGEIARCRNDYTQAKELYEKSYALRQELQDKNNIAGSLQNLAYVALNNQDFDRASSYFKASISLYQQIANNGGLSNCLTGFGGMFAMKKIPIRATHLFAKGQSLRESLNSHMAPADQIEAERNLSLIGNQLEKAAFEKAWGEGLAMTVEEAIAEALLSD